jgi:predicted DNA-binding protein
MATLKGKQIITNVYLPPEVYEALKRLSDRTGAPMAHYLRLGAERVLAENGVRVVKTRGKA